MSATTFPDPDDNDDSNTAPAPVPGRGPSHAPRSVVSPLSPVPAAVRSYPHRNDRLAGWDAATLARARALTLGLCAVFGTAEAVTAQAALLTFTRTAGLAWLVSVVIIVLANAAAYTAGTARHKNRGAAWVLLAGWAVLGAALVALRLLHAAMNPPAAGYGATATDLGQASADAFATDTAMAVFLAGVYLVGGLLTRHKAQEISNPQMLRMVKARTLVERLRPRHTAAAGRFTQASGQHGLRLDELDRLPVQERTQHESVDAMHATAKEHARHAATELRRQILTQRMDAARTLKENLLVRHATAAGRFTQASGQHGLRLDELDRLPVQERTQHESVDAMHAAAKEHARQLMAELLGDPRKTGMVHHTPHPADAGHDPASGDEPGDEPAGNKPGNGNG